ncbi:MAG: hypothetical protein RJQ03_01455 [Miltoncostaeaceae bacterium]
MRSSARGRWFKIAVIGAWPLGVAIGLGAMLFGWGIALGIASGLAVALGINFVWVVSVFAVDDGRVDRHVREDLTHEDRARTDSAV